MKWFNFLTLHALGDVCERLVFYNYISVNNNLNNLVKIYSLQNPLIREINIFWYGCAGHGYSRSLVKKN